MKVTLIKATDKTGQDNFFVPLVGLTGQMSINSIIYFDWSQLENEENDKILTKLQKDDPSFSFEMRHGTFRTSAFVNIARTKVSYMCYDYTIETRNSIYVFREGEIGKKDPFTPEQKELIMRSMIF